MWVATGYSFLEESRASTSSTILSAAEVRASLRISSDSEAHCVASLTSAIARGVSSSLASLSGMRIAAERVERAKAFFV